MSRGRGTCYKPTWIIYNRLPLPHPRQKCCSGAQEIPPFPRLLQARERAAPEPEGKRDDSTPANTCLTASTNIPGWHADPSAGSTWPMHAQVHLTTWGHACLHACTHRTLYPDCQAFERYGTPVSPVLLGWSIPGNTSVCGTHIAFSVELQRFLGMKPR